jgi:biotin carboxyl carrier protein
MNELNPESIRRSLEIARDNRFRSIKIKMGETSFQAIIGADALDWGTFESMDDAENGEFLLEKVTSPFVGTVRLIPEKALVGATIKSGDVIGEVIALGISNELTSSVAGEVKAVAVQDGSAVEYGQTLLEIQP